MDDLDLTALPIVGHGDDEDGKRREPDYPRSWKLAAIITALCLAVFCMALDNTIIATAIPRITDEFGALQDVAWYISTYLLTTASFQLFFGKLYSFYSIKWTFLSAVALFELGSLVCGAAPSSRALIVGRAIAGLGSAGLFSGGLLIIAHTVPLRTRPLYTGAVGSMYGVASVAGPLLGGVFTDHLSWRWCFYINLPLGAITLVFVFFFLHTPPRKDFSGLSFGRKLAKLDILGTTLFVPAIICLILALQWGGLNYDWSDGHIIGLLVAFVVLIAGFLVVQWWRQDNGTVPPRIFLRRSVAAAAWWTFTFGGSFFIMIYFVPIWFQSVWGVSATQSGIDSLPLVLSCALFSVVSGVGITLVGYYTPWLIASSLIMCAGCGVLSTFHPSIPIGQWVGYQIFAGAGFGLGVQIPLITVQAVLPLDDVPIGTAVIMFAQTLGGTVFIAVAQNVFLAELSSEVELIIPGIDVRELYQNGGATSIRQYLSGDLLSSVLDAYSLSLDHAFLVATALAGISILGAMLVEWKSVKGQFLMGAG